MKYDLKKPCAECPFTRGDTAVRLYPERVQELIDCTGNRGREFACHNTVDYDAEDEGVRAKPEERHCAGALIYAEKQGTAHQMARICERIGMYDASKLDMKADVFDDADEFLATALESRPRRKKAK